jgi:putative nucleotidyltransferase with HDIG domain
LKSTSGNEEFTTFVLKFNTMASLFFRYIRNRYLDLLKIGLIILSILLTLWFIPHEGKFKYEFQAGKPWNHESLIAPFDFAIRKSDRQISSEKTKITSELSPYFSFSSDETRIGRDRLMIAFEKKWREMHPAMDLVLYNRSKEILLSVYDTVEQRGVIQFHQVIAGRDPGSIINIVKDVTSTSVPLGEVFTIRSAFDYATGVINLASGIDQVLLKSLLGEAFVQNLVYDERITRKELNQALENISTTFGMIEQGELIISQDELIDESRYAILSSLRKDYEEKVGSSAELNMLILGQFVLISVIFIALYLFIRQMHKDIFGNVRKLLLVLSSMLLIILPSYTILKIDQNYIMFFPFGILPIILMTFFESRITIIVHMFTILIVALAVPSAFAFVFLQMIVGFVVMFSLANHNRRNYYFRTSSYIFLTYFVLFVGFNIIQEGTFTHIQLNQIAKIGISATLTLLALPMVYFFERVFGLLTDLTLLELSNTNSPLLRQLAQKAPGTFQHSMQVANLAEEALFVIGGDTLLARTGAFYHDIGKMVNPLYFIENQSGGYNPHNDLTSAESARMIIDHVVKGIEMARKSRLPEQIIDFIRTHHGDRRVEYFYFLEQKQNPGLALDERDFRYRGPIPFSKETAVVMMADSVEAASRSIKNPTEQKLNDLVENIVARQMEGNQFVNADITMREIITVKKILKKKLMNIYHVRIEYPD